MAKGTPRPRRRLIILVAVGMVSIAYGAAYLAARRARLLIHAETCLTGHGAGLVVDEHNLRRGDPGIPIFWNRAEVAVYFGAYYVFLPAMLIERGYWYVAVPVGSACP